jgi:hypothetical protein
LRNEKNLIQVLSEFSPLASKLIAYVNCGMKKNLIQVLSEFSPLASKLIA